MKTQPYSGTCRECGRTVWTRLARNRTEPHQFPNGIRVRCGACETTNWVETHTRVEVPS